VSGTEKITIRPMVPDDVDNIVAINTKIAGADRALTYASPRYSYLGGELSISMVAEVDGKIVGFILGRLEDSARGWLDAWTHFMGVDPDYYRQGVGTKLMEGFITRCKAQGAKAVHMMVNWNDWKIVAFLQSLGFSRGNMVDFVASVEE